MISDSEKQLFELFEEQVKLRPNEIALEIDRIQITYSVLGQNVDKIAGALSIKGLHEGDVVAVQYKPSMEMITAALGVIKAGGTYLPVDFDLPAKTVNGILEHSRAEYLINVDPLKSDINFAGKMISVGDLMHFENGLYFPVGNTLPNSPLFVSYKAYLHGKPQGVVLSQKNVLDWMKFNEEKLNIDFSDSLFIETFHIKVDFPVWMANLAAGGKVHLCFLDENDDFHRLSDLIEKSEFKSIVLPLSLLSRMGQEKNFRDILKASIRNIISIGEDTFDAGELKNTLREKGIKWYNYFGFPEIQMVTTLLEDGEDVRGSYKHYGRPVTGTKAYVLNHFAKPVSVGIPGKLYISGNGVFTGYHRDDLLMVERFGDHSAISTAKLYQSDYKVKWLPDGKLKFEGRTDNLIQINGFRICPDTIEFNLLKQGVVRECAVVLRTLEDESQALTLFISDEGDISSERIEACLKDYLPKYLFPLRIVRLDAIPITQDGETDRSFLESMEYLDTRQCKMIEVELMNSETVEHAAVVATEKLETSEPLYVKDFVSTFQDRRVALSKEDLGLSSKEGTEDSREIKLSVIEGGEVKTVEGEPSTLVEALEKAIKLNSDKGIIYIKNDGSEHFQTYASLLEEAQRVLKGLRSIGLKPQDKAILQFKRNEDYIVAFWGCVLGGIIPVPVMVPKSFKESNNETSMLYNVWETLDRPVVLASSSITSSYSNLTAFYGFDVSKVINIENLRANEPDKSLYRGSPEDLTLILFTSGSTGIPKGVMQCHRSILAREKSTTQLNQFTNQDISINWMPLEHVGGVVMFHLKDMYLGCTQIQVETEYILSNPFRWMDLISKHKATITWAPNFAFNLVNERIEQNGYGDWDLSTMRFILNGGEAINAKTAKKFLKLLKPCGLPDTAMHPSWGMSETCSGVVYSELLTSDPDSGIHVLDKFSLNGLIKKAASDTDSVTFVELGVPIPGVSIRIADSGNKPVREMIVGRIQIKGPTVTSGYYHNPELNREVFTDDGWFETGDLGFICNGRMTISGRAKDIVIINGVNYNNNEIESFVEEVDYVDISFTAACAVRAAGSDTDSLIIFYSSQLDEFSLVLDQIGKIRKKIIEKTSINPSHIIPVRKEDIPKTSIGKIQRNKLAKAFETGEFDEIIRRVDLGLQNENTLPQWFYKPLWREKKPLANNQSLQKRKCIIFEDTLGLGEDIGRRLEERQCQCIKVKPGKMFQRLDEYHFEMNYKDKSDYIQLVEMLENKGILIEDIFHLCNYSRFQGDIGIAGIKEAQYTAVFSLLFLIQALDKRIKKLPVRLFVVSSHGQLTSDVDTLACEKTTIPGFVKSLSLELPWLSCRHIDLETQLSDVNAEFILNEWRSFSPQNEIAYRDGRRLVSALNKCNVINEAKRDIPLKKGGLYLITGGLGGIGVNVCQWLTKKYRAKLIIAGRTSLPERDQWQALLENEAAISKRIKACLNIEAAGGEFIYCEGDISDETFLREAVAKAELKWDEQLSGIFHLAGDLESMESRWTDVARYWAVSANIEEFEKTFMAKVYGSVNLYKLLENNKKSVFVAYSSTMSFFGGATYAAYASANSFIDGLCAYRLSQGYSNTYCFNWSMWDNIGMSEDSPVQAVNSMKSSGFEAISMHQGINSLQIALRLAQGQTFIGLNGSHRNIRRYLNSYPSPKQSVKVYYSVKENSGIMDSSFDRVISSTVSNFIKRKSIQWDVKKLSKMPMNNGKVDYSQLELLDTGHAASDTEYVEPETEIEKVLVKFWKDILGKPYIGINDNFFELGGHSLKASVLVYRINKEFNVEISLSDIFKAQTVREQAELVKGSGTKAIAEIEPVGENANYPKGCFVASFAQKRLFIQEQFEGIGTSYNIPVVMKVAGKLDKGRLEEAFVKLIKRHESLRTSFEFVDMEIVQRVHDTVDFRIEYFDADEENIGILIQKNITPFNLNRAPLFRVKLLKRSEDEHILIMDIHHIISDGVSVSILFKELAALYEDKTLSNMRLQYKDYSAWQNGLINSDAAVKLEKYWADTFEEEIPALNLPTDFIRPDKRTFDGNVFRFNLSKELVSKLNGLVKTQNITLNTFLFSIYAILLNRYCEQEDIVIGTLVAGRNHPDLENITGMFNNYIPVRNIIVTRQSYLEFLNQTGNLLLSVYENQEYPYDKMVEKYASKTERSRNPLFDTMLIFHNELESNTEFQMDDLKLSRVDVDFNGSKLDLKLDIYAGGLGDLDCIFEYNVNLFKAGTIEKLAGHFTNIVNEVIKNPEISLTDIELLSEKEKDLLLKGFNDTHVDFLKNATIPDLFEQQVEKTPEDTAVIFENDTLTYKELNIRANQLAKLLREKGVGRDTIVGLLMERSLEMGIAIIAVLKAGGAYLPISPEYPVDRIQYMLKDSGAALLLTQNRYLDMIPFTCDRIDLDNKDNYIGEEANLEKTGTSQDLAYVIYTSGSTGKPKGAMIEHCALVNRLNWMQRQYPIGNQDVILQKTPFTFDVSVWELLWWSLQGAKVCFLKQGGEKDPGAIVDAIEKYGVTTMHFVPSMLNVFLDYIESTEEFARLKSLKRVFASGEALNLKQVEKFNRLLNQRLGTTLHNLYGPTEATVDVSYFDCSTGESLERVPIGRPIDNINLYILNKNSKLQPVGVPGELHIGGVGLARGYLNKPELTVEKFIANPFIIGERMYKTGDIARWLPDGNVEYLGRIDHQVKIRGFRIELGEIEAELLKHESVKEALVLAREESSGSKYLCAYIVTDCELTQAQIKEHLSMNLPEYMVPSYFINLEKMPLSSNGKVDRKALPEPETVLTSGKAYVAPSDDIENRLAEIWQEILGIETIGVNDDFFDLGGHSLKATTLVLRIQKEFNIAMPLMEVFKASTISALAANIKNSRQHLYSSIGAAEEKDNYLLSSSQKRLFILNRLEGANTTYNLPAIMMVEGEVDINAFNDVLKKLIERHESLRTSFELVDGQPVQMIHKNIDFKMDYSESDEERIEAIINHFIRPFDLDSVPLFRAEIVKIHSCRYLLMLDMHHIISDGLSMVIFVKEFMSLYCGYPLPDLKIQYKDYSEWQNRFFQSQTVKDQEDYWLRLFEGEVPVLNMPYDFPRPSVQSFEGECLSFKLDKDMTDGLIRLASNSGATLYMVLLAAYNLLLFKYTGQEDIIVGSPLGGRVHTDLENLIGMFVNTLPMRNYPKDGKTFTQFLSEVKTNALSAFENQDYQFEALVDKLKIKKDISRNPLFDAAFVLQNMVMGKVEFDDLKFIPYTYDRKVSKFDMTLEAIQGTEEICINLEYSTRLFKRDTMERLAGHFTNIITAILKNSEIKLSDVSMLSEEEQRLILNTFNDTKAEYPKDKTIQRLFEEQVEKTPESIAVIFQDRVLTYQALNQRANQLAGVLRSKGVGRDCIVALLLERSIEMSIAIMAVLKAGGAYLPISTENPPERIKYILEDSGARILLTNSVIRNNSREIEYDKAVTIIDVEDRNLLIGDSLNPEIINEPNDLAYVIYTSGSTGKPKGVMIEHYSLINRLNWMQKNYPLGRNDVILQKTPYTFDVSVWEIFWWSLAGAKVCYLEPGGEKDPGAIIDAIEKHKVTTMHFVPSMLSVFLEYVEGNCLVEKLSSLRQVFASGEALNVKQVNQFNQLLYAGFETKLHNLYGPTEATVDVSYFDCSKGDELSRVPIGKPIDNTALYILDRMDKLQPVGVPGELHISGDGLARGYLNKPEMTREKFVSNPFEEGKRMYRTGDIARWLPDGNIEYLGRKDHQVKIRGFRIELGEIETELLKHQNIKETVVTAREDGRGNKYLCAYMVTDRNLTVNELKAHLSGSLPEYMVPSYFVTLDKIPLSSNGKADRKMLPEPELNINTGNTYAEPTNDIEKELVQIWREVLGVSSIGIHDNFFDLGGNSLLLIRMHSKLEKRYQDRARITDLFIYSTVSKLAAFLSSGDPIPKNDIQLKYLVFPEHYFANEFNHHGAALSFKFDSTFCEKIKKISSCEAIETMDMMLSAYVYALAQATQQYEIPVQTMIHDINKVDQWVLDLKRVNDFVDLYQYVKSKRTERSHLERYAVNEIEGLTQNKSDHAVLALFYDYSKMSVDSSALKLFDLVLEMKEEQHEISFSCEYNPTLLRHEKIKELIQLFTKTAYLFVKSYEFVEEGDTV